jgi:hypothetical protein
MRNITWFILGIGSALIWGHTASFAQDAPRPIQVIIGPDGVKVIDPKTGKEVPSVVTRIPDAPPTILIELDVKPAPDKKTVENLRAIEEALRDYKDKKDAGIKASEVLPQVQAELERLLAKDGQFKILIGPDGKAKIIVQHKAEPLSTDKKIDLLLKQVAELHHDVDAIKKKLDIKPTTTGGPRGWGDRGPKQQGLDKETLDRAKAYFDKLAAETNNASKGADKKQPASPDAEIERRLERILREAEELRREIRELQTPKKK